GVGLDDRVLVSVAGKQLEMTVVGVPVFPDLGFGPGFGQGAGLTIEGLRVFYPGLTEGLVLGRYAPGVVEQDVLDRVNPALKPFGAEFHHEDQPSLGSSAQDAQRSRNLPVALGSLFALTALATLIHLLITSVRRRRRDLAILRTLGFRRRQILATVAWQSAILAAVALVFGIPSGVLLGRFGWALFADRLGIVSEPVIAWIPL